jgi:glycosyltransferase involved in cell wall biosynthesis
VTGAEPVVVDLRGLRAGSGEAPPGSYGLEMAIAIEKRHPDLVSRYFVEPELLTVPPEALRPLAEAGKLACFGGQQSLPEGASCFWSMAPFRSGATLAEVWPAAVEHRGLRFSVMVADERAFDAAGDRGSSRRRQALREVVRLADAVLARSAAVREHLVGALSLPPDSVTDVSGAGPEPEAAADTAAAVLRRVAERPRVPWTWPVALAFVSPFPPILSGVATYSSFLIEPLGRAFEPLVLFADGRDRNPAPAEVGAGAVCADPRGFRRYEAVIGGFEHVLYVMGNSEYHTGALTALRERAGVVLAHEVNLSNLFRDSTWQVRAVPGGLEAAVRRNYGGRVPDGLGRGNDLGSEDALSHRIFFFKEVAGLATRVLVNSEATRQMAVEDAGPELAGRIGVVPFAFSASREELRRVEEARAERSDGKAIIGAFGIVDPSKRPDLLIEALARLVSRGVDASVVFVGPVSDQLRESLGSLASALGVPDRVVLTGGLDRTEYMRHLGRCDVAVQLRRGFHGEASGGAGDCLAAGVPTIVTGVGWLAELPADTVVRLDPSATAEDVAAAVFSLLEDEPARRALGERAARFAAGRSYEEAAEAIAAELRRVDAPAI